MAGHSRAAGMRRIWQRSSRPPPMACLWRQLERPGCIPCGSRRQDTAERRISQRDCPTRWRASAGMSSLRHLWFMEAAESVAAGQGGAGGVPTPFQPQNSLAVAPAGLPPPCVVLYAAVLQYIRSVYEAAVTRGIHMKTGVFSGDLSHS